MNPAKLLKSFRIDKPKKFRLADIAPDASEGFDADKDEAKRMLADGKKLLWKERFHEITAYERHLTRNGIAIIKFFLHISKEEQRKRFLDRLEERAKRWKFSMGDVAERALWDRYMEAYEDMIRHTST